MGVTFIDSRIPDDCFEKYFFEQKTPVAYKFAVDSCQTYDCFEVTIYISSSRPFDANRQNAIYSTYLCSTYSVYFRCRYYTASAIRLPSNILVKRNNRSTRKYFCNLGVLYPPKSNGIPTKTNIILSNFNHDSFPVSIRR